jgi:hypothetical protein
MVGALYQAGAAAPIIEKPIRFLAQAFGALFDGLKFIPAQLVAIDATMQILEERIDIGWGRLINKADILSKKATSLLTFDPKTKAILAADIAVLEDKIATADRFAREKGKTLGEVYNATLKEQFLKLKEFTDTPIKAPTILPPKTPPLSPNQLGETAAGTIKAGQVKAAAEREKEAAKIKADADKARADELKAEADFAEKKRQVLADLNREIIAAQLSIMADGKAKELQAEQNRTDAVARAQRERVEQYKKGLEAAGAKIASDLGKDSEEFKRFSEQASKDIEEIKASSNTVLEIEAEQHRKNLQAITAKYDASDYKAMLEQQTRELAAVDKATSLSKLKLAEAEAKIGTGQSPEAVVKIGVEFDEKEFNLQKAALLQKLDILDKQLLEQQSQAPSNPLITDESINATIAAKQALNTELAILERDNTNNVAAEAAKREAARYAEYQRAGQIALAALDFIGQLATQEAQREQEAIQIRLEAKDSEIATIEDKLSTASGLQKEALESQLNDELAAKKTLEKQSADLEKKAAIRQKAISIIQSLINTALAISGALAAPPFFPLNSPSVITAGVLGAIQTAAIIAQPLATGGKVVGVANIPQLPNGDNVFTTLRLGEVVMNEYQQRELQNLAGHDIFTRLQIPGFAAGGVVGAAIPTIKKADNGIYEYIAQSERAINALDRKTDAIFNAVLTLKVSLNTDELSTVQADETRIRKKAIL